MRRTLRRHLAPGKPCGAYQIMTSAYFLRSADVSRRRPAGRPETAYRPTLSPVTARTAPAPPVRRAGVRADLVAGAAALLLVFVALGVGMLTGARLYGPSHFCHASAAVGEDPVLA